MNKTFEEFLRGTSLPNMAKILLPASLSEKTIKELLEQNDTEQILKDVIEEINKGSVQSIEVLVKKRLNIS